MSQFYASIQGTRGEATRQGHKRGGIQGHIRGWSLGVRVYGFIDEKTGKDMFRIYRTGGSNGNGKEELIAEIREDQE